MNPLTWPRWLGLQVSALIFAVGAYTLYRDGGHSVFVAVVALVMGEAIAVVPLVAARLERRRLLRDDPAAADRLTIERAVLAVRTPEDPRLAEAATRLARRWAGSEPHPANQLFLYGWLLAIVLILAVYLTPWAWLGVAVTPVLAWFSVRGDRRRQDAAARYLRATDAPPAS